MSLGMLPSAQECTLLVLQGQMFKASNLHTVNCLAIVRCYTKDSSKDFTYKTQSTTSYNHINAVNYL